MGKTFMTVILPLRLEWNPYYYAEGTQVCRGDRVRVMVAGKYYHGVVYETGVVPVIPESKIKPILAVEPLDRVSPEEIALWEFMAEYYMCTLGEVYKAAYPVGRISEEQIGEQLRQRKEARKAKALAALEKKKVTVEARLAKRKDGLAKAEESAKARNKAIKEEKRSLLLAQIGTMETSLAEILGQIAAVNSEDALPSQSEMPEIKLSKAQETAYQSIVNTFGNNKIALLDGITGSGKTEIYCRLAQETLSQGRNVLYLVPEIALSRQLEDRLEKVFGERLLTSHSGESYVHRREVAAAVRESLSPYVLLGTRSAIFLPYHDLGLIIVDEEHDTSYKQDSPAPRYNGRDCALIMGRIFSCPVILGSATPSLESLYNASKGRYETIYLKERFYEGEDPDVEVIDTIAERRKKGMVGSLSRKLIAHIYDTLERGEQVLVLRGRKAYSPAVQCDSCGKIAKCPHCNVALSYHKDRNRLVCHYCGHSQQYTESCPDCGGKRLPIGAGTQKIEEEISALFPSARVGRLDGDNQAHAAKTIAEFAAGTMDILVGTQMVSKGFDFENLTLVAVVQSDSLLGQQDFRADERAVQLLEQLRGRGGRRGKKSLFVIQTSQPGHPVYSRLTEGTDFTSSELGMRRDFGFPPFTRIVSLTLRDTNLARLEKLSMEMSMAVAQVLGTSPSVVTVLASGGVCVSYPYPPSVDRQADESIRVIRVTMARDRSLSCRKTAILKGIAAFEKEKAWTGHTVVDVDPI